MPKAPSFQFYPADWLNDIKLQSCSLAAQGLLMNIMCLMHQSDRYGHLLINGAAPASKDVSRLLRVHHKTYDKTLIELLSAGALCRDENGFIFCARMVKDEHIRQVRRAAGAKGGSPLLKQNGKQKPTPSSSSSSSSSTTLHGSNPPAHIPNAPTNSIPFAAIVDHLNARTGKDFDHRTKDTRARIKARWNEGHRLADFIAVIDNKTATWLKDADMLPFLRPQTLFGTKFEAYKQDAPPATRSTRRESEPDTAWKDTLEKYREEAT